MVEACGPAAGAITIGMSLVASFAALTDGVSEATIRSTFSRTSSAPVASALTLDPGHMGALVHLVRNAVDHGIEDPDDLIADLDAALG